MAFSPLSFAIGMGVAYVVPILTKTFRPLAVEAAAMGLGLFEDVRRIVAEQVENLEDIAAEARARREEITMGARSATMATAPTRPTPAPTPTVWPSPHQTARGPAGGRAAGPASRATDLAWRPQGVMSGGPTWSASFTTFRAAFACDSRYLRTVRVWRNACEAWPESSTAPGRLAPRDC